MYVHACINNKTTAYRNLSLPRSSPRPLAVTATPTMTAYTIDATHSAPTRYHPPSLLRYFCYWCLKTNPLGFVFFGCFSWWLMFLWCKVFKLLMLLTLWRWRVSCFSVWRSCHLNYRNIFCNISFVCALNRVKGQAEYEPNSRRRIDEAVSGRGHPGAQWVVWAL